MLRLDRPYGVKDPFRNLSLRGMRENTDPPPRKKMHMCTKFEDNFKGTCTLRSPSMDLRLSSLTFLIHSSCGQIRKGK